MKSRRLWLFMAAALVAAAAFWYILRNVDLDQALRALRSAEPAWVFTACLVNVFTILVQGERLHQLLGALTPVSRRNASEAVSLGFAGSVLLPARGGEVIKLHVVSRATRLSSSTLIGLITVENIFNFFGLLLMAGVVFAAGAAPGWIHKLTLGGAAGLPVVLLLIYRMKPITVDPELHPWRAAIQRFRNSLHEGFTPLRKPKILGTALILTVSAWTLEFVTTWCTLHAFHVPPDGAIAFLLLVGVNVAVLLPLTPGQVGVYEIAATVILRQAGVETNTAVMLAIVYHLVHMAPTLLVAIGFLLMRQLRPATPV